MKIEFKSPIQKTVMTGVCAALLAVLSQISIPLPTGVPITLQTFAVALCGYILGPALGALSVLVYLALGAIGLPVFAGFSGLGMRLQNRILAIALGIAGLLACHVCGVVQFAFLSSTGFLPSALAVSVPYLVKDILSVALAYFASLAVLLSLKRARLVDAP